ncbi:MAG: AAA family ATPase [Pseudothermotoga sp.]
MPTSDLFEWEDFYREFANKLLEYRNNRGELIEKIKRAFERMNFELPTLERGKLVDIDPFTVFALFNRRISNERKIGTLEGIAREFDLRSKVPRVFNGVPDLNPLGISFYNFIYERAEQEIDNLWELFDAALKYSKEPTQENRIRFSKYFDITMKIKHNGTSKVTSALFWIAPDSFVPLDSYSRQYIYNSGEIPSEFLENLPRIKSGEKISADKYLKIVDSLKEYFRSGKSKVKNFKELSHVAWTPGRGSLPTADDEQITIGTTSVGDNEDKVYDRQKFLEEVFMSEKEYDDLVNLLKSKQNVILQGPPGVGKTFIAKRLVYSIMESKDEERVMMIQFHQSYSYEDFIEGFRPSTNGGFEIRKGPFYKFCKQAEEDRDHEYFFIIDEINRGNISKIFGELFMLIENDKRGIQLPLLYSGELFSVPSNVYIIGTMNTADRSLALLDYALRRRFAFYSIKPAFESDGFKKKYMNKNPKFDRLIEIIKEMNRTIAEDDLLGEGFCIGHSYFCREVIDGTILSQIVEYELIPLINEYWFDDRSKVQQWSKELRSAIG